MILIVTWAKKKKKIVCNAQKYIYLLKNRTEQFVIFFLSSRVY